MTSLRTSSRTLQAVAAFIFGTACLLSQTLSAHAATPDSLTTLQAQLMRASAQLQQLAAARPTGEVLGASTSTTPVRPVCRLDIDKKSYTFGQNIQISWSTTGASNVAFVITPGQEGKDFQTFPQGNVTKTGTATVKTSVFGMPTLTLKATSITGQTVYCTKYFAVVEASTGKKDTKIAGLEAQIMKLTEVVRMLVVKRDAIEQKIAEATAKSAEIQALITKLSTGGHGSSTHGSSTGTGKPSFEFVDSTQTLTVNDINVERNTGEYTLNIEVTAVGSDIYIPKTAKRTSVAGATGISYVVEDSATGRATALGVTTATLSSTADTEGSFFKVNEGETESFTVTVVFDPSARGTFQVGLVEAFWGRTTVTATNSTVLPTPNVRDGGYESDALFI